MTVLLKARISLAIVKLTTTARIISTTTVMESNLLDAADRRYAFS